MTAGAGQASDQQIGAQPGKLRALVIGSGHRARNAFLPALKLLEDRVDIVGVHSRTPANARTTAERWGTDVVENLGSLRPGDVDIVLLSVTVTNNVQVLQAAAHLAPGASLVIDTPGVGRVTDLLHLELFRRWGNVRVAEDFMNLPQFRLIRSLIEKGLLGDITQVAMSQVGYRYHALALVRSWLQFQAPSSARSRRSRDGGVDIEYRFGRDITGVVLEPYEQAAGSIVAVGNKAVVAGHPMGYEIDDAGLPCTKKANRPEAAGRLKRIEAETGLVGFAVTGLGERFEIQVGHLPQLRAMGLEDDSEFNLLRVDGLSRIISSLWTTDPVNSRYRIEDAIADLLVSAAARRIGWLPSPRRADRNMVDLVDSVICRLTPSLGA
jgi:hypothetical protein